MAQAQFSNPHIQTALSWCDDYFADEEMWPELVKVLLPAISGPSEKRDALITSDLKGARFLLNLIADAAGKLVGAGDFHIYRGMLSLRGQSLKRIAASALGQVYENEWLSLDSYQQRLSDLDDAIANCG